MKAYCSLLGPLAVVTLALLPLACKNTAEGVKKDTQENTAAAKEEAKEAEAATRDERAELKDAAKDAGAEIKDTAQKAGETIKSAAKDAGAVIDAKKQTLDVKAALMADTTIDASKIDVDTEEDTKIVTLKGVVANASQKAAAERIAQAKAEGYTINNRLTIAGQKVEGPAY